MEIIEPSAVIETPESHIKDYMTMLERYGRTCHQSSPDNSEESAENFVQKYLIDMGHESVLEHCVISVRFICDRSASHQLVRHRLGSYSQESQRRVDYSGEGIQVICPPEIRKNEDNFKNWMKTVEAAERGYQVLLKEGIAPEDARSVLPNCTKTEVVATFNLRQWRHVFSQRALNPHAQWQIRELMSDLMKQMVQMLPVVFSDLQQKILYRMVFQDPNREGGED